MEFSQNAFAAPSRTLTSFGTGPLVLQSSVHTSLANGTTANLLPSAGIARTVTLVGEAAVNVTWTIGLSDGATFRAGPAAASGAAQMQIVTGNSSLGPAINNSGTVSGNYNMAGYDFVQ